MRGIAESVAALEPDVLCVHGIAPGDALALATRFDFGWAYRGAQALFWSPAFVPLAVRDGYLPVPPLRPFERRGLLEVDGLSAGQPLKLLATQLSQERAQRIRDLRYVRGCVRRTHVPALLFIAGMTGTERIAFGDLGFACVKAGGDRAIYALADADAVTPRRS
jgi:hypothetical protein